MPRVRIESVITRDSESSCRIMNDVMDTIVEVLQLAEDDRNISYTGFEEGLFQMKPPYQLYIEICLFAGRTKETKKQLYKSIVEKLYRNHDINRDSVMIQLNEQPRENWGLRGGISGDEIFFDYRIEI